MSLGTTVQKLYTSASGFVKKEREYCTSACFFLTTRGLDVSTTMMGISQKGMSGEVAPVSDYFMRLYGGSAGLFAEQITIGSFFLTLAYCLNKKELKWISGNRILNGASIVSLGIGAINMMDYFNVFNDDSPITQCLGKIF